MRGVRGKLRGSSLNLGTERKWAGNASTTGTGDANETYLEAGNGMWPQPFEQRVYIPHGNGAGVQIRNIVRGLVCHTRTKKETGNKGSIFGTTLITIELGFGLFQHQHLPLTEENRIASAQHRKQQDVSRSKARGYVVKI